MRNISKVFVALALSSTSLYTTGAQAQSAAQPGDTSSSISGPIGNGDIVVTATKRKETARNVAGSVIALSGEALENINAHSMADYAAFVPGLSLQPTGRTGETTVTLRGITALSVGAATGTYIDDVPYGSANNYSGGASLTPDLDPADLERVEILKGPQGTLYGASSLGGLVKYVTRDPSLTQTQVRIATDDSATAHGAVNYGGRASVSTPLVNDVLALRVSGYYNHDAGYVDDLGVGGKDTNHSNTWGFRGSLLYKPTDRLKVRLSALLQNIDSHGLNAVDVNRTTLQPLYDGLTQKRQAGESDVIRNRLYSGTINYDLGFGSVTSATSYSQVRSNPYTDYSAYLRSSVGASANQSVQAFAGMRTDKTTEELRLASASNGHLEWIVGGFFQHEHSYTDQNYKVYNADGSAAAGALAVPYVNHYDTTLNEFAGFGNLTYYLTPKLDITGGYRFSHNEQDISRARKGTLGNPADPTNYRVRSQSSSEGVSTYLATIRYRPTTDLILYARAASGYRPGGPRDIAPGSTPPANFEYSFKADTVWNYEIGAKAKWFDGKLTTDIAGFWIDWQKIQSLQAVGAFRVFGNAGNARIKGVEASTTIAPTKGLSITGNLTYTDARLLQASTDFSAQAGDPLPYTARWSGAATINYERPISPSWTGFIGGDMRATSDRYTDFSLVSYRVRLPGYALYDLQIGGYDHKGLRVTIYAKNLTDKRAYTAAASNLSTSLPLALSVVQPRTVGISLAKAF